MANAVEERAQRDAANGKTGVAPSDLNNRQAQQYQEAFKKAQDEASKKVGR